MQATLLYKMHNVDYTRAAWTGLSGLCMLLSKQNKVGIFETVHEALVKITLVVPTTISF